LCIAPKIRLPDAPVVSGRLEVFPSIVCLASHANAMDSIQSGCIPNSSVDSIFTLGR